MVASLKNKYKNKIVLLYAAKNQLEITKGNFIHDKTKTPNK